MPEPVAVVARTATQFCPYESGKLSRRLRNIARAPLIARPGRGFIYVQTPESSAEAVAAALERLLGSRPVIVRPPEPESPMVALQWAVQLTDLAHYWLAHEVLEHAWGMGAVWLHAPTVATAALVKAQEGNVQAAEWIVESLGRRVEDRYSLVDWECIANAIGQISSCQIPYWAGECIGVRVYNGPLPVYTPGGMVAVEEA